GASSLGTVGMASDLHLPDGRPLVHYQPIDWFWTNCCNPELGICRCDMVGCFCDPSGINPCAGNPCGAGCLGAACDPACGQGGYPCSPGCPTSVCNRSCAGSNPCDPSCEDLGGGPCGENCATA